jgi:hypothetical protein
MLLTPNRIIAASRNCRFNGWTSRHYSILEHMVIGTHVLRATGAPRNVQRGFLLHDFEETEVVGDVPSPDKALYMNADYYRAVEAFDRLLCLDVNLEYRFLSHPDVRMMDAMMAGCESQTIYLGDWRAFHEDCPETDMITDLIKSEKYADTKAIFGFQTLMGLLS